MPHTSPNKPWISLWIAAALWACQPAPSVDDEVSLTSGNGGGGGDTAASVNTDPDFRTFGQWTGYASTFTNGQDGATTEPLAVGAQSDPLCVSGTVVSDGTADNTAGLLVTVAQPTSDATPQAVSVHGTGLRIRVTLQKATTLYVQVFNDDTLWCYPIAQPDDAPATVEKDIPWGDFRTSCNPQEGAPFAAGSDTITGIAVAVRSNAVADIPYDFCLLSLAAYPDDVQPTEPDTAQDTTPADTGKDTTPVDTGNQDTGNQDTGPTLVGMGSLSGAESRDDVMRDGDYYAVQSNVWGNSNATQRITYVGNTFVVREQTGDNSGSGAPVSYPSAFIGSCYGRDPQGDNLPIAVSAIQSVETSWTWDDTGVSGIYNASYDVWFSRTSAGDPGAPSGGYLMVWLWDPPEKQPRGGPIAHGVTVAGVPGTWDVWTDGQCISYVRTTKVHSMTFDLNAFIKDATTVHTGTIQNSFYLTNVFAGFEIWSGGVGLKSTDFYVKVK